jgi:hypothetical protein
MTSDEMEAKLHTLEARIASLEQRQEAQGQLWSRSALIARVATIVLAFLTLSSAVVSIFEHQTDPITPVFGCTMTVALFLSLVFTQATGTKATGTTRVPST